MDKPNEAHCDSEHPVPWIHLMMTVKDVVNPVAKQDKVEDKEKVVELGEDEGWN